MNKRILMIVVLLLVVSASAMAETFSDCPALSRERIGQSEWRIGLNPESIQGNGQLHAEGKLGPSLDALWGEIAVSSGNFVLSGWSENSFLDFTFYEEIGGERIYVDPQSQCPKFVYPKDAPPNKQYIRLPLVGEKFQPKTNNVQATINYLLLLKKSESSPQPPLVIHQCAVLSVKRTATYGEYGEYGDYEIVLSLQKFHGAPPYALPYVDRQTAPDYVNIAWTGFGVVKRQDDTAVVEVKNWPITWSIRLSIKLVANGIDYWQDMYEWLFTGCQNNYFSYGDNHFIIPLL